MVGGRYGAIARYDMNRRMTIAVLVTHSAHRRMRYEVEGEVKHIPPHLASVTFARSLK